MARLETTAVASDQPTANLRRQAIIDRLRMAAYLSDDFEGQKKAHSKALIAIGEALVELLEVIHQP